MDKLKSLGSKFSFPSTPGGKLSKAFRLDKEHNVLKRSHDPFTDEPMLEDVSQPVPHEAATLTNVAITTQATLLYPLRLCKPCIHTGRCGTDE